MKEQKQNIKKISIPKSPYINNQNQTNNIIIDKLKPKDRSLSFKNEYSENNHNIDNKNISAIKKLQLSPPSSNYNSNNNSEKNSICESPQLILKKPEENIEKFNLEDVKKEEVDYNLNKTNIINNINNNNNKIFINIISSNTIPNDLSRNIGGVNAINNISLTSPSNYHLSYSSNKINVPKKETKDVILCILSTSFSFIRYIKVNKFSFKKEELKILTKK